jgi:DNA-binding NarL/FixJ family response regulator
MALQAEHLGGEVRIDATPGWGTTIRATVPYRSTRPDADQVRPTILVVEHRPVVRAGLVALLARNADSVQVAGEIDGADGVLEAYRLLQPDVVIIGTALPAGTAAVIDQLRQYDPSVAVVALGDTSADDDQLRDVVLAGARAVVTIETDGPSLTRAIGAAARGEALFTDAVLQGVYGSVGSPPAQHLSLTPREREVTALASQGLPDRLIAERLHISAKTVEKHVGSALRKTGAHNRTELAGMTARH